MVNLLDIREAGFSYDGKQTIFDRVTFSIKPGEIFCILGPNGIGKSTLLRCLGGLLTLQTGSITLQGQGIHAIGRKELGKQIGFIPQGHQPAFPYSVKEFVLMGRAPYIPIYAMPAEEDHRIAEQAIRSIGLVHLMEKSYTEISGGERQMALFARVLAQNPQLLLLDEPTSHLDLRNQLNTLTLIETLCRQGLTAVLTTHLPDQALLLNATVAIMKDRTFMAVGPAREVITVENLKAAYGIDVQILSSADGRARACVPVKHSA
ncbi:MAG: ABC transporter ATP-binding protein [Desulfobacteraceae bacterium]|nr:MAG: ABC transporter ATP-binding protein [Desulfobacteraceae bacterium]